MFNVHDYTNIKCKLHMVLQNIKCTYSYRWFEYHITYFFMYGHTIAKFQSINLPQNFSCRKLN